MYIVFVKTILALFNGTLSFVDDLLVWFVEPHLVSSYVVIQQEF